MKTSTLWLVSLVIGTSLMVPLPLSNASVSFAGLTAASAVHAAPAAVPDKKLVPAQPDDTVSSPSFMDAVNQWIKTISGEQGYQAWKQATWTSQPLGPGTHGWIVLLQSAGQPVGYMVIHAADPNNPSKYRLTEYGNGNAPLFSLETLYQSLVQLELIDTSYETKRLYTAPFHAVWKVTTSGGTYYIDAKTGEELPLEADSIQNEFSNPVEANRFSYLQPDHSITASLQLPGFDPYERLPWVQGKPLSPPPFSTLQSELEQQKKLIYTAELYRGKVTVPFPVTGYQLWSNNEGFLLLEQNGQRAISYDTASIFGKLYP